MSVATALRISTAEAATSGPIPSPGRSAMLGISCGTLQIQGDGAGALPRPLVGGDVACLLQREIDVVQAVEQPLAAILVQFERDRLAGEAHLERLEVDLRLPGLHERSHLLLGQ